MSVDTPMRSYLLTISSRNDADTRKRSAKYNAYVYLWFARLFWIWISILSGPVVLDQGSEVELFQNLAMSCVAFPLTVFMACLIAIAFTAPWKR